MKNAAKTRKVDKTQVLSALSLIEKAKLDPSKFLETLGGTQSPGRTWMLIFTAEVCSTLIFNSWTSKHNFCLLLYYIILMTNVLLTVSIHIL